MLLTWPDGEIIDQWIEVTVLANANTELASDDVFYFASAVADFDGNGTVNISDYLEFKKTFGLCGGPVTLDSDFNADGRVDLNDFSIIRSNFGNVVDTPSFPPPISIDDFSNLESPMPAAAPQANVEAYAPVAPAPAPVVDSNPLVVTDANYISDASDDSIVARASEPIVDLLTLPNAPQPTELVDSLSAGEYISDKQTVSASDPQLAATTEYDLRSLGDDPVADDTDDLLADLLAESALLLPL